MKVISKIVILSTLNVTELKLGLRGIETLNLTKIETLIKILNILPNTS